MGSFLCVIESINLSVGEMFKPNILYTIVLDGRRYADAFCYTRRRTGNSIRLFFKQATAQTKTEPFDGGSRVVR